MSCEQSRGQWLRQMIAEPAKQAQVERVFGQTPRQPLNEPAAALAAYKTQRVAQMMEAWGVNRPKHWRGGMPHAKSHAAYAAMHDELAALGFVPQLSAVQKTAQPLPLSQATQDCLADLQSNGMLPLLAGGCVRDFLMNIDPKDVDIEVFGGDANQIAQVLARHGRVDDVGKSFGVLKVRLSDGQDLDVALPRTETHQVGGGHRDVDVHPDPHLPPRKASERRDLRVNAMYYHPTMHEVWDMSGDGQHTTGGGGMQDLRSGTLRHTSEEFARDPLRVLRVMQFAARWGFNVHPDTAQLARDLSDSFHALPKERVWGEWEKLCSKGKQPSQGLRALQACGWDRHTPALKALQGVAQDPGHHPEGDAWQHTLHVADAASAIAQRDGMQGEDKTCFVLAAICHDLGKSVCTVGNDQTNQATVQRRRELLGENDSTAQAAVDGMMQSTKKQGDHIRSPGHERIVELTRNTLQGIGCPAKLRPRVVAMVREHMAHIGMRDAADKGGEREEGRQARYIAERLHPATVRDWARISEADLSGRPPLPATSPADRWLRAAEREGCADGKVPSLLQGRDLIRGGLPPGKYYTQVLADARQAQLDGAYGTHETAEQWLSTYLSSAKLEGFDMINSSDVRERGVVPGPAMGQALKAARQAQLQQGWKKKVDAMAWLDDHLTQVGAEKTATPTKPQSEVS